LFVEANNSLEKNNSSEKTCEGPLEKDLTQMSYEDQMKHVLEMSLKESKENSALAVNEDEDLQRAIDASMVDSNGYLADQSFDCEDEVFAAIDESNPKEKEDKEIPSPPKRARCAIDAIEDGGIEEMSAGAQVTRSDGNEILYQLTAVVTHLGATVEKGHYVADVYCKKAKDGPTWFHYNDSEVTKTQFQNVHRRALKDGYIFVYSKAETG